MFAYCNNNPVMFVDYTGELIITGTALLTAGLYALGTLVVGVIVITAVQDPAVQDAFDDLCSDIADFFSNPATGTSTTSTAPSTTSSTTIADTTHTITSPIILSTNKFKKDDDRTVAEILKGKKGSIKNAKKPPGYPSWDELIKWGITLDEIQKRAKGDAGWHEIYKLLTDGRFNK